MNPMNRNIGCIEIKQKMSEAVLKNGWTVTLDVLKSEILSVSGDTHGDEP